MQVLAPRHLIFEIFGILLLILPFTAVRAQDSQYPEGSPDTQVDSIAELEQILQLDSVEFHLRKDLIDWSSIDGDISAALVQRYLAQTSNENDVMMANAHEAASDAMRRNFEQPTQEMRSLEKRRHERYLKEQGEKQSQRLVTAIDRNRRLQELVVAAIEQTGPILAAKGEMDLLRDNSQLAIAALQKAAAEKDHKYCIESLLALQENWKDLTIPTDLVSKVTATFTDASFSKRLKILQVMVAFDDTTRAIALLSEELKSHQKPTQTPTAPHPDESSQNDLQKKIDELTKSLDSGGVKRTDPFDSSKQVFQKWGPSDILNAHQDRAKSYTRLAYHQHQNAYRLLTLAEKDALAAKDLNRSRPSDEFRDFNELVCLELQCQALTAMFKNCLGEPHENDIANIRNRLETVFAEREELLLRLPEQTKSDIRQKKIRTAMALVEKAEFASLGGQPQQVIDCDQKLQKLGDEFADFGDFRIVRDAYLQVNDPKNALRIINNALIKGGWGNTKHRENGSDSPRLRRTERIENVKRALPDLAVYWQLAQQVGDEYDRERCRNYFSQLIDLLN
jgi:hypothetical protein